MTDTPTFSLVDDGTLDSDELPIAILVQGDDLNGTYCGSCLAPAVDWPRVRSYHPISRPATMFRGDLFCADCMPRAYDGNGSEVRTFCGNRHAFTDGEGIDCGCF